MGIRPVTGADYKAEDIVTLLADAQPATGGEYEVCTLCEVGVAADRQIFDKLTLEEHEQECPWRLAREWAAANITLG